MEELSDKHKEFLAQIRALRKKRKLTLVQCAEAMGTSHSVVSQFETGDRNMSIPKLIDLLDVLDAELVIKERK
jgi:transcriptional regulator with XRE-family HTH domain